LQAVAENLWVAQQVMVKPGRVLIPLNMTVLRLRDGSLEQLLAWPFERIIPAHGVVYESAAPLPPAREAARAAFGRLLA
jgi:hypothetical protein